MADTVFDRIVELSTLAAARAEKVCHEEQLRIWANDLVGLLSMQGYLRDDLTYDDGVHMERYVMDEIKSVVEQAFDHPELTRAF
jgi:hypothetical protein